MKSSLFLAVATLARAIIAKTISTTITTCDCTTTATPLWSNSTSESLETLRTTSSSTRTVTEVFTPEIVVTVTQNATATPCDSAVTVYETTTPVSVITITVTPSVTSVTPLLPHMTALTAPYVASNTSTTSATFSKPGNPSGWPNPSWTSSATKQNATSSATPVNVTSSTITTTSTYSTPKATMWEGSGGRLVAPRLFFVLANVFSLIAPVRGRDLVNLVDTLNWEESRFYPENMPLTLINSDVAVPGESRSLATATPSTDIVVTSTSITTTVTETLEVSSPPPGSYSSWWSSESDVTVTVFTSNCSTISITSPVISNSTVIRTSMVYTNATVTQFTTKTPVASGHPPFSSPLLSMPAGGVGACLHLIPGWIVLGFVSMLMIF